MYDCQIGTNTLVSMSNRTFCRSTPCCVSDHNTLQNDFVYVAIAGCPSTRVDAVVTETDTIHMALFGMHSSLFGSH
jgi:hypothetical protein